MTVDCNANWPTKEKSNPKEIENFILLAFCCYLVIASFVRSFVRSFVL